MKRTNWRSPAGSAPASLEEEAKALFQALEQTRTKASPLDRKPPAEAEKGVRWVEPRLIAQVDYHGWTSDGLLWHASFRGLRDDKDVREIVREDRKAAVEQTRPPPAALTHPERLLWPDDGVTKQGLADYYAGSAEWVMPHLVGRPLSLVRCPNGVAADCFFAKHAWAGLSDVVRRASTGKEAPALAIEGIEGLLSLVQGNVLEIHPWGSNLSDLERPDRLIFDLDPGEEVAWSAVIEAALEVRARLLSAFKLRELRQDHGRQGAACGCSRNSVDGMGARQGALRGRRQSDGGRQPSTVTSPTWPRARAKEKSSSTIFATAGGRRRSRPIRRERDPERRSRRRFDWDELTEAVKSDHYRLGNIGRRLANLRRDPWEGFFEMRQAASAAERRRKPAKAEGKVAGPKERAGSR